VSVEHVYRCDGPECEAHLTSRADQPPHFITTYEVHEDTAVNHFCNWDCLMKFAAQVEPPEIIPFEQSGGGEG
jgi:hypothetical protein